MSGMTDRRTPLLLATANPGKRAEFARILPAGVRLVTLAEMGLELPPETGVTLAQNARAKAVAAAAGSGLLALGDDSGLEVVALGGAPGVRSARYAGEPPDDAKNRARLLASLAGVEPARRGARFRCAMALAKPEGVVAESEGICVGAIATAEAGEHGFGYDAVFLLSDGLTMAQVGPRVKDLIGHRARATEALLPRLLALLGASLAPEARA